MDKIYVCIHLIHLCKNLTIKGVRTQMIYFDITLQKVKFILYFLFHSLFFIISITKFRQPEITFFLLYNLFNLRQHALYKAHTPSTQSVWVLTHLGPSSIGLVLMEKYFYYTTQNKKIQKADIIDEILLYNACINCFFLDL